MRKIVTASALSLFVVCTGLVACDKAKAPNETTTADSERDLNLASSVQRQRTGIVSPIEQMSNGAPSGNNAGRRLGVETKKRAPSPAQSPQAEDIAIAPPDAKPLPTSASVTNEVAPAEALPAPAPAEAPVMMVTDPIRNSTASAGSSAGNNSIGINGGNDRGRFGSGDRGSMPEGAIIRGGQAGIDHCEPMPGRGGNGILGQTFGATGGAHAPQGSTSGGTGARGPENGGLPPGLGSIGSSGSVSAGVARGPRR
ncbi:MAG: hypothetical protein ABJB66_12665 [Gemmatimonadaceae bacterium]